MGGAGVAEPQDTNAIVINPAGLSDLGGRFDISFDMHMPSSHMNTSAAPVGNVSAGKQKSGRDPNIIPTGGISYAIKDTPWTLGFGLFGLAGCGVDYEKSRLSSAVTGNSFDKFTDYQFMTIAPAASYRLNDKLALGLAVNFDYSTFKSDTANSLNQETSGAKRKDDAYGAGFVLGAIYKLNQKVSLGLSYTSRQWMQKFAKYQDSVPRLDMAPSLAAGIGFKPNEKWLLATDFKWIDWNSIPLLKKQPAEGGFGWKDQYIYSLGAQYKLTPYLTLRSGYSYGNSPIADDKVFANALFPAVTEHHLAMGMGYKIGKNKELSLTYEHAFKNTVKDTGLGDTYSVNGKGTEIDLACDAIILEWSVLF